MNALITVALVVVSIALHGGRSNREAEHVDLIELNHYYGPAGDLQYAQVIAYEWSPDYRRYHVRGWFLVKELCHKPYARGGVWYVPGIRSERFRQTWIFHDP